MMQLDELAPNAHEERLLTEATSTPMPEQVKIGYLRAMRKANGGRAATSEGFDLADLFQNLGDL